MSHYGNRPQFRPGTTVICNDCHQPFTIRYGFEVVCLPCWKRRKGITTDGPLLVDDMEMIRKMLRLVHPDKHRGSASLERLANNVTVYLLDILQGRK